MFKMLHNCNVGRMFKMLHKCTAGRDLRTCVNMSVVRRVRLHVVSGRALKRALKERSRLASEYLGSNAYKNTQAQVQCARTSRQALGAAV